MEKIWHVMLFSDLKGTYETPVTTQGFRTSDYLIALVKNSENRQKVLKVALKGLDYTVIDITPKPKGEELKGIVAINGQEVPVSTQHVYEYKADDKYTVLQVYGLPTGEVKVVSPIYKLAILYYGNTVRVTVNQDYMNNVRGLCGTNNGDNFDFVTPQEYVLQDPEEFAATWALSSEGRTGEKKNQAQQHSVYKKSVEIAPIVSDRDLTRVAYYNTQYQTGETVVDTSEEVHEDTVEAWKQLKKNSATGCVTNRIVVVEKNGKHCFSVTPQPTCVSQCQPEKTQTRTGEFFCVKKSGTTKHWEQMVARGANPDFRNKGKTQELDFESPTRCV